MASWLFGRRPKRRHSHSPVPSSSQAPDPASGGRRHREDVPYALPKDLEEGQRLNLQHYLLRYALRGNYAAPLLPTVSMILDVGSGTGIWGHEMAQAFPAARVFGLDLEPPQSVSLAASASAISSPSNYHFVQGNVLQGLPFPDQMFDYTHQRMLVLAIPLSKWPGVLQELKRVTRPGGWVELLELGAEIQPAGPATVKLLQWSINFLHSLGIDSPSMRSLGPMLTEQGFTSVSSYPLDIPLGSWDRRLGVLLAQDIRAAFQAIKPRVCEVEHLPPEDFERVLEQAVEEWNRLKATYRFYLACGQA